MIKINNEILPNASLAVNRTEATLEFYSNDPLSTVEQMFLDDDLIIEQYNEEEILISKYYINGLAGIHYEKEEFTGRWRFIVLLKVSTLDRGTLNTLEEEISNSDDALVELAESVALYEAMVEQVQEAYNTQNASMEERIEGQNAIISELRTNIDTLTTRINQLTDRIVLLERR